MAGTPTSFQQLVRAPRVNAMAARAHRRQRRPTQACSSGCGAIPADPTMGSGHSASSIASTELTVTANGSGSTINFRTTPSSRSAA